MTFYWDKYEKKYYDIDSIKELDYSIFFLLHNHILVKVTHDHGERVALFLKGDKRRVVTMTQCHGQPRKKVSNLKSRGWVLIKDFGEGKIRKEVQDVYIEQREKNRVIE